MTLPQWASKGVLPLGVHKTDLAGLYARCVQGSPKREEQEALYSLLVGHLKVSRKFMGSGRALIGGSLLTRNPAQTLGGMVHIALIPNHWNSLAKQGEAIQDGVRMLCTQHDVIIGSPQMIALDTLPAGSGRINSFLCRPRDEAHWIEAIGIRYDMGLAEVTW